MRENPKRAFLRYTSVFLRVFLSVANCRASKQVAEYMCRCMLVLRNDMRVPVGRDVRAGMTQPGLWTVFASTPLASSSAAWV